MITFEYEALNSQGNDVEGTVEACSESEAQKMIREKNLYITKLRATQMSELTVNS